MIRGVGGHYLQLKKSIIFKVYIPLSVFPDLYKLILSRGAQTMANSTDLEYQRGELGGRMGTMGEGEWEWAFCHGMNKSWNTRYSIGNVVSGTVIVLYGNRL